MTEKKRKKGSEKRGQVHFPYLMASICVTQSLLLNAFSNMLVSFAYRSVGAGDPAQLLQDNAHPIGVNDESEQAIDEIGIPQHACDDLAHRKWGQVHFHPGTSLSRSSAAIRLGRQAYRRSLHPFGDGCKNRLREPVWQVVSNLLDHSGHLPHHVIDQVVDIRIQSKLPGHVDPVPAMDLM